MSAKTFSLILCWLLVAALSPATVQAERARQSSCQASKGKAKGRASAGRSGRGSGKSKAASQSSPAPAAASESESDESDDLSGLDDVAPAKQPEPPVSKPRVSAPPVETPREPAPADDEEEAASEPAADEPVSQEPEAAPPPERAAEAGEGGPSVLIEPFAGLGIATRSVRMPAKEGALEVAPGVTPAAEVGLRVLVWPNAGFSFFVNLVYQSALGFSVTEHPPLALDKEVRARSERVALEVAPRWRFAGGKLELAIPVGATVRTLWAEVHTSQTPSYSLVGPHARAELRLALSDMLSLRLGPELHYIVMVDKDLTTAGVASQGVALGGDASLEAQVSEVWSFRVTYRESHALLGAARGTVSFQDVERYLTLRAVGSF